MMAKKKQTSKKPTRSKKPFHERVFESDSTYFLKLVAICILGTFWLRFVTPTSIAGFELSAMPLGLAFGILVVRAFEHHQEDRKIWYAVLLVVTIVSAFFPETGINI